jgi:hypothetical protein
MLLRSRSAKTERKTENKTECLCPLQRSVLPDVLELRLEGLDQLKKCNYLIGNRNRDLPACSIVPEPTTLTHGETEKNKENLIQDSRHLDIRLNRLSPEYKL